MKNVNFSSVSGYKRNKVRAVHVQAVHVQHIRRYLINYSTADASLCCASHGYQKPVMPDPDEGHAEKAEENVRRIIHVLHFSSPYTRGRASCRHSLAL